MFRISTLSSAHRLAGCYLSILVFPRLDLSLYSSPLNVLSSVSLRLRAHYTQPISCHVLSQLSPYSRGRILFRITLSNWNKFNNLNSLCCSLSGPTTVIVASPSQAFTEQTRATPHQLGLELDTTKHRHSVMLTAKVSATSSREKHQLVDDSSQEDRSYP